MLTLRALRLRGVESAHTLLQAEKRLINLRTFNLSFLVIALAILSSLRAGKIDEKQLTALTDALLLDLDLRDGMTSTGSVISLRSMSSSHLITLSDQLEDLVIVIDELFFEAYNLDGVVFVLSLLQLSVIIQEVIELASVNLVHGHGDSEVSRVVLPVVDATLEEVLDSNRLNTIHRVRLATAGLTVSENGDDTSVEDQVEDGTNLEEIELFIRVVLIEGIVEFEVRVFNCLGHAVNLVSAVVDDNARVAH